MVARGVGRTRMRLSSGLPRWPSVEFGSLVPELKGSYLVVGG